MQKTGVANLPLHPGKAPRWLFQRMVSLSRGIAEVIAGEYGADELLRRLCDPFWFQALACVLAWDWHSSGATTVTCGALKEAINNQDLGISLAGGKGRASQHTLQEIELMGERYHFSSSFVDNLRYCSRMAAKVDSTAVQDGHTLYHHVFVLSENKKWAVIQQGLNTQTRYARRYHWCSDSVESFICEPHDAIVGDHSQEQVLDMTAKQSVTAQRVSVDLINDNPLHLRRDWADLTRHKNQRTLDTCSSKEEIRRRRLPHLDMPRHINWARLKEIYDVHPRNYEELLSLQGVGPSTVRGLALVSELLYGAQPSWHDPVRFSFAFGGKDGVPRPVDRKEMDESAEFLRTAIENAKVGDKQRLEAISSLRHFLPPLSS